MRKGTGREVRSMATIEHEQLKSNVATAAALYCEWLRWCDEHGIDGYAATHISKAFIIQSPPERTS